MEAQNQLNYIINGMDVFDVNGHLSERRRKTLRKPERGSACGIKIQGRWIAERQNILKAPHIRRAVGKSAQDLTFECIVIIPGFKRLRFAFPANRRDKRLVGLLVPAKAAFKILRGCHLTFPVFRSLQKCGLQGVIPRRTCSLPLRSRCSLPISARHAFRPGGG